MSAPETQTFRDLRQRHRAQTRLVREQARQLRGFEDRERRMRAQIEGLPEPGLKAVADVVRRRGDLSMAEALSLVAEVFNGDE